MVTRKKPTSDKKSKMTVMVLQIEGDDVTLQEGFRTLNTALESIAGPPRVKIIEASDSKLLDALGTEEETQETTVEEELVSRKKTNSRTPPKTPEVLDLALADQSVDIKEFLTPESDSVSKKYLLIAYWLKRQLGISSVSSDHIHTCYRYVGWNTPKDASQPLRDLKSKSQWMKKGEAASHYDINHVGENEVRALRTNINELPWSN